jgi:hypothetical protein
VDGAKLIAALREHLDQYSKGFSGAAGSPVADRGEAATLLGRSTPIH